MLAGRRGPRRRPARCSASIARRCGCGDDRQQPRPPAHAVVVHPSRAPAGPCEAVRPSPRPFARRRGHDAGGVVLGLLVERLWMRSTAAGPPGSAAWPPRWPSPDGWRPPPPSTPRGCPALSRRLGGLQLAHRRHPPPMPVRWIEPVRHGTVAARASTDRSAPPDERPTPPPPRPGAPTGRTPPPGPSRHEHPSTQGRNHRPERQPNRRPTRPPGPASHIDLAPCIAPSNPYEQPYLGGTTALRARA